MLFIGKDQMSLFKHRFRWLMSRNIFLKRSFHILASWLEKFGGSWCLTPGQAAQEEVGSQKLTARFSGEAASQGQALGRSRSLASEEMQPWSRFPQTRMWGRLQVETVISTACEKGPGKNSFSCFWGQVSYRKAGLMLSWSFFKPFLVREQSRGGGQVATGEEGRGLSGHGAGQVHHICCIQNYSLQTFVCPGLPRWH